MANDPYRFKLGVFVVTGAALAIGGFMVLGAGRFMSARQPLFCYFNESVQGLAPDSELTFRGVKIGRVKSVSMLSAPKGSDGGGTEPLIRVECEIDPTQLGLQSESVFTLREDLKLFVREQVQRGLRMEIQWADLTGKKYLLLDYVHDAPPESLVLPSRPEEPFIPTYKAPSLSSIQRNLASTVGSLSEIDYSAISQRLLSLLETLESSVEEADLGGVSREARDTFAAIRKQVESQEVGRILKRLDSITASFESTAKRVDELVARDAMDEAFDDAAAAAKDLRLLAKELTERVPSTLKTVDALMAEATTAIEGSRLPETSGSIRDAMDDVGQAARNFNALRDEMREALRGLAAAGRQIARLSRTLEERPSTLFRGKRPARAAD